jgi:hypothetical protein
MAEAAVLFLLGLAVVLLVVGMLRLALWLDRGKGPAVWETPGETVRSVRPADSALGGRPDRVGTESAPTAESAGRTASRDALGAPPMGGPPRRAGTDHVHTYRLRSSEETAGETVAVWRCDCGDVERWVRAGGG